VTLETVRHLVEVYDKNEAECQKNP